MFAGHIGAALAIGRAERRINIGVLGLAVLALVTLVFTVVGMTVAPPPPSVTAMAGSSMVTVLVVSGLAGWIGKRPKDRQH
jgi:hypothetical protein